MTKYFRYFEYAYLIMGGFFIFETFAIWDTERSRAYIFIFLAAMAIFMFFFKRNFRRKLEKRQKNKK